MGKKERKKSNRKNQKRKQRKNTATAAAAATTTETIEQKPYNFLSEAGQGCYIARRGDKSPDWMIDWEDVDPKDFAVCDCDCEDTENNAVVPDIAIDPDYHTLSICNIDNYTKVAYVTVFETTILGGHGKQLIPGLTTPNKGNNDGDSDNDSESISCTTFIVLCPPHVFTHLCYLNLPNINGDDEGEISNIRIESDVSKWKKHPKPDDEHPYRIGFPLNSCDDSNSSFLCTQGEGGELTHFFSGSLHAIDFRCPVGTELLAVADGIIIQAKDDNTLTGIAVTNLFTWNSILLQIHEGDKKDSIDQNNIGGDGPLFVEYVHISKSLVKAGDLVQKGQVIGYSGNVGFSPEPHLHFSAFRSDGDEAPTVRVLFEISTNNVVNIDNEDSIEEINEFSTRDTFLPRAGEWYDASGKVDR